MYLFHRKADYLQNKSKPKNSYDLWNSKHAFIENTLILMSFICSFYLLHIFNAISFIILLPIGLICLAYILRILPLKYTHLRAIPFAKSAIIAFVWTLSLAVLPFFQIQGSFEISLNSIFICVIVFFYVLCQVIIFDFKDVSSDKIEGLKTFVTQFGAKKTKLIGWSILLMAIIITMIGPFNVIASISILLSISILALLIWKAKSQLKPLYYYIVLESTLGLPFVFFKISEFIF